VVGLSPALLRARLWVEAVLHQNLSYRFFFGEAIQEEPLRFNRFLVKV
jgi:hypothetical protein